GRQRANLGRERARAGNGFAGWAGGLQGAAPWVFVPRLSPAGATKSKAQALPDGRGRPGLVERVEMQSRRAALEKAVAEVGHDVEPEGLDRSAVVAEALELEAHPARDLRPAGIGK